MSQKYPAKEMRSYILVSYVIVDEAWLHYFGGISASYISDIYFDKLPSGDTTESRLRMIFVTWCIVKLDCYIILFRACIIIIVANYISHMSRNIISWRRVVCYISVTPDFFYHI